MGSYVITFGKQAAADATFHPCRPIRKPPSCVYKYIRKFLNYLRICVYCMRIILPYIPSVFMTVLDEKKIGRFVFLLTVAVTTVAVLCFVRCCCSAVP